MHIDPYKAGRAHPPRLPSKGLEGTRKPHDDAEAGQAVVETREVPCALVDGAEGANKNGLDEDVAIPNHLGDREWGGEAHKTVNVV